MRASTLFALAAAILIGLGVAVSAKLGGLFNQPVEPPAKKPEIPVLVAARNLFADDVIDTSGVRVRLMRPEEVEKFEKDSKYKDQLLPPIVNAAHLRVAKANIEADTPITRDMLKEMEKPQPLHARLLPQMRAVNIVLPKERSAGGMVQVGEWVELYLTSTIDGGHEGQVTKTAVIAPKVRVIAKRDTLWPVFAPLPKDKPVEYTLEVNPYRAALIEYARNMGHLSIVPLPQAEQKKLDARRDEILNKAAANPQATDVTLVQFEAIGAQTAADEIKLVKEVESGELVVGDADLARIFDLKPPPPAPPSPAPPPALTSVERVVGTRRMEPAFFTPEGKPAGGPEPPAQPSTGTTGTNDNNPLPAPGGARTRVRDAYLAQNPQLAAKYFQFRAPDCPTCKAKR